jgi:predicted nucleotidyltransferase
MKTVRTLSHPDLPDPTVLGRIADRLKRELGAERVVVYGSVAKGEATRDSDIDLLVIAPSSEKAYLRMARVLEVVEDMSRGIPLSPIVLTPEEVQDRIAQRDSFLRHIFEEGVPL